LIEMLTKVMIDFKGIEKFQNDLDEREYFLLPYIYLFADEIMEPIVCDGPYFPKIDFPSYIKPVYIFNENPPFVFDYAITAFKTGVTDYMGSYFTPVKQFKKKVLSVQGVTAYNSILLLAASGLELQIPGIKFDLSRSEEIEEIRTKLETERKSYALTINKIADEAFDRLKSESYQDTVNWAINEALLKIQPRIAEFENAVHGLDKKLLQRIGIDFVKEGIPSIGNAFLEKGVKEGGRAFIASILKTLCTNLFRRIEERKYPDVVYGYKLSKYLKKAEQQL